MVSIPDIEMNNEPENTFVIYPNPVEDMLFIQPREEPTQFSDLRIYDISGRIVLTSTPGNNNVQYMDVSGLRSGIYMVEIIEQNTVLGRGKIVVR